MSKNSRRRREKPRDHDRAWSDYTQSFRETVLPALLESAFMITVGEELGPDALETLDLRAATELGLMLLLDKPLIICVPPGTTVWAARRRAAHTVVDDMDVNDPTAQERLAAALAPFQPPKGAT